MTLEQADPDRLMRLPWVREVDWDAVYAKHLPRIYNYFRFRLGSEADVEDLTSLTFEKAWRGRSQYRRDLAGFSTWLYRIAHNVGVDHLRSRRTHVPIDEVLQLAADGTPELDLERDSNIVRLAALTARLSEREQELVALKYGAELTNRHIAQLTGLSESNVGTLLHRAVRTLRSEW